MMRKINSLILLVFLIFSLGAFSFPVFANGIPSSVCPVTEPGRTICSANAGDPYALVEAIPFLLFIIIFVIVGVIFLLRGRHQEHLTDTYKYATINAMPNSELKKYIQAAREQNISDETIKNELLRVGWSESLIEKILAPDIPLPSSVPVPPVPHFDTWIVIWHIFLFLALYASAISLVGVLHNIVDKMIPGTFTDPYSYGYYNSGYAESNLKWYVSVLVVAFPIFAYLYLQLQKQVVENPFIKHLYARRFFMVITFIGTSILLLGNAVFTIYEFLGGSLTLRLFLHFAVTVLIYGSIFFYLLSDVREDRQSA